MAWQNDVRPFHVPILGRRPIDTATTSIEHEYGCNILIRLVSQSNTYAVRPAHGRL
jgi:hypothetical protein